MIKRLMIKRLMIKRLFFLFIILLGEIFVVFSQDNVNKSTKKKKFVRFKFYSKTYAKVGLRDKDDTTMFQFGLDKNCPKFSNDLLFLFRITGLKNKRFILAPYVYSYFFTRLDYKKTDESTLFLERLGGVSDIGVKIGYRFGKKKFKGSYFAFTIPLSVQYNLLYDVGTTFLSAPNSDLSAFHTGMNIGSRLGFIFNLRLNKYFMRFKLDNTTTLFAEILNANYVQGNNGFFFENDNILNYRIAPFNFINKKIDVYFSLTNEFVLSLDSYNLAFDNEISLDISWKGLKYFHVGYTPLVFRFKAKLPLAPPQLLYDGLQKISMEIWLAAGYKFFWAKISYEPTIFSIDKTNYNGDSVKPHYIKTYFEFKL